MTSRSSAILASLVVFLLVAGCGSLTGDLGTVAPPPGSDEPSFDIPSSEPTPGGSLPPASGGPGQSPVVPDFTPDPSPIGKTIVRSYFFLGSFVDNAGLAPVLRQVPTTKAVGAAAVRALLEGPNEAELGARPAMYTVIPEGTRLLGLRIDHGIATVNLSREFEGGGGTASILGRLAQVVFTLTQFPTIEGVKFELDGEPVTVFSGEGIALDEPVSREDYYDQLPAVYIERPAWGGVPNNPARFIGLANVFEATFQVRLLDEDGRSLADGIVNATCGTGCWGTFDESIPYNVPHAQWGTIQVYVLSAKDGSVENLTEYPVWLRP
jgi:hypothetical protein